MKKLLVKTLILLLPFFLLGLYIEPRLKKIPNSYSIKRLDFESQLDSVEILVLGNSESLFGIDPACLRLKGFNLANINQSIFYDTELALKYAIKMPRLKYVIFNITYFSLGSEIVDDIESWRDYAYYQFWDIRYPKLKWYDAKLYSTFLLYTPLTSMSYIFKNFKVNLDPGNNKNGWGKMQTVTHEISDDFSRKTLSYHDSRFKQSRVYENLRELNSVVTFLKKRNIETIFITTPVYQSYTKYCNKIKLKENNEEILKLCEKNDCRYYDYSSDKRFTNTDSLFENSFHLNYYGAEKFSKIINEEIFKP